MAVITRCDGEVDEVPEEDERGDGEVEGGGEGVGEVIQMLDRMHRQSRKWFLLDGVKQRETARIRRETA
jgi:hypothetical protein